MGWFDELKQSHPKSLSFVAGVLGVGIIIGGYFAY